MNAFITKPKKEFQHKKPALFLSAESVVPGLFEFAADAHGSSCPLKWGDEDHVYPSNAIGTAVNCLMNNRYMKQYVTAQTIKFQIKKGAVNRICLTAPSQGLKQTLYFYDYD